MKKFMAMIAVLAMCVMSIAAGAEQIRTELPDVMLKVKAALEIGDEYTDFSSSNYDGVWDLYWTGDENEISVTCDGAGRIFNYYTYDYDYEYDGDYAPRYPAMSAEELRASADDFLGRVIAADGEGWVIDDVDSKLQHGAGVEVNVEGRLTIMGKPTDTTLSLSINSATGKVRSFYRSDGYMDFADTEYDLTEGISTEEAYEKLKDTVNLEAVYYVTDAGEMARLVYMPADNSSYIVRASDGELIDTDDAYNDFYGYNTASAAVEMGAAGDVAEVELTETELAGISVYDNALGTDELDAILRGMDELDISDEYYITDADYYERGDALIASVNYVKKLSDEEIEKRGLSGGYSENYDSKYITADANTGRLMSLYSYYPGNGTEAQADETALTAAADDFIQKYFGDYTGGIRMENAELNETYYSWYQDFRVEYVRMHNGYPFRANSISVGVNAHTGKIDRFDMYWDEGQEFVEDESIINADAALDVYLGGFEFENAFVTLPEGAASEWELTYERVYCWRLRNAGAYYAVDALTGELLTNSYDNGVYVYDDLDGNEHAAVIEKLGSYGIGYPGGQYIPDAAFTFRDALVFITQAAPYNYEDVWTRDIDALIGMAEDLGAHGLDGFAEDQQLARGEFTKILVSMSGYEKAAQLKGLYACGFADDDEIAEDDYSYVAIAYGMGLIEPDENGNINAGTYLTRADAAVIFHNMLSME